MTAKNQTFCRNTYNVTGLCTQRSCPLANSRYATVMEKEGKLYLYMKTVERAHLPNKLWERVLLDKNYAKSLKQLDNELIYWPSHLIHKCKVRLTKLTQMLIRMRKLRKTPQRKLVTIKSKEEKQHKIREKKALIAAKLDTNIEKELVARLNSEVYPSHLVEIERPSKVKKQTTPVVAKEKKNKEPLRELVYEEFIEEESDMEDLGIEMEIEQELDNDFYEQLLEKQLTAASKKLGAKKRGRAERDTGHGEGSKKTKSKINF
eukprot:TRINITY_DN21946_c0_g1_i1.p1 TRINITY_DN21946_c0_g1~~TRINITY_DN21946_c0_g1_i1.p1  ORF type:complete len:295 (+),score=66.34 TRINITY_DN21946_c0_g1_i1:101-886(+)